MSCYLKFKLHYLKNLKSLLIHLKVKELFEPTVLRKKKADGFFALFKSIFLRNRSLNNGRWFYGKKRREVASLSLSPRQDKNISSFSRAYSRLSTSGGQEWNIPYFSLIILSFAPIFSSIFPHFLPQFGPPAGRLAYPGRLWLRHWRNATLRRTRNWKWIRWKRNTVCER